MNGYQPYPNNSGAGPPGPPSNGYSDPRLPPRPALPPAQSPQPPQHHHRGSFDYPSYPPPPVPSYQSGPPPSQSRPPPQNHAGPSGYVDAPPPRDQRYGGPSERGPGYGQGPDYQPQSGNGPRQERSGYQSNGPSYGQDHRRSPDNSYPSLPPIHFTDRQNPPYDRPAGRDTQGYPPPLNGQNHGQSQGYGSDSYGPRDQGPPPQNRQDRPRENFSTRDRGGRGRSPDKSRRPPRSLGERDRDNRSNDHRMKLERACRTLFVRNVNYDADTDALKFSFEQYGQIKTYFDLVKQRGMIFITYFDLRAAGRARDGMHDSIVKDRKIDVHYSLPRPDDQKAPANRDSNQGSVVATLLRGPYLTENDLGGLCEQYGEVKSVRPGRSPEQKIVEFYDARGATLFYDQMHNRPYRNGTLELRFIWDENDRSAPPPPGSVHRGGRAPSRSPVRHNDGDRRDRRNDRSGGGGGDRRYGDGGRNPPDGRGGGRGSIDHRGPGGPGRRRSDASHQGGPPPGPPGRYNDGPPPPVVDDRLEQARKVQDLLNSLSAPPQAPPPPPPQNYQPNSGYQASAPVRPPPAPPAPYRSSDPRGPSNNGPSYAPPAPSYGAPPQNYNYPPANPSGPPPPSGNAGIPPEVLSLLQANNVAPPPMQQPPMTNGQPPFRPPPSYRTNGPPPPPRQQEQGYQPNTGPGDVGSLLAMLQQSR